MTNDSRRPEYLKTHVGAADRPVGAFTLLELLVAMAVLSLLVVVLMSMVDSATKLWKANENRVESFREARAAINLIASDLKVAFASTNTNYFTTNIAPEFGASPSDGSVFFVAALPPNAQDEGSSYGDLCQVGYFLKFGKSGLGSAQQDTYGLYRYFKESNATFTNLANSTPLFEHSTAGVELLARNISFFKVNCYSTDAAGTITPWVKSTNNPVPNFVEIQLVAYNNDAAKRFSDQNSWKDTNSKIYQDNSRIFSARIPIRQPQ
jgi:prepilin-type N-terminal cleavage/methylation domain-containing protein